ncbi:MAG: YDG domain-containing protein, partial [Clostridiales bacterium]|nr:YDG domain-containing protein [Clostridiales bacterium]
MKRTKAVGFVCVFLFFAAAFCPTLLKNGMAAVNAGATVATAANSLSTVAETTDTGWYSERAETYSIDTIDKLRGLAALVDEGISFAEKTVFLTDDIETRTNFTVGRSDKPFSGTFRGNGNRLLTGAPLFYSLERAVVTDLFLEVLFADGYGHDGGMLAVAVAESRVERVTVRLDAESYNNRNSFGGIAAYAKDSVILNCAAVGSVKKEYGTVGGLVAVAEGTELLGCYNAADITVSYLGAYYVGGIVGEAIGSRLVGCVNYAEILLRSIIENGQVNVIVGRLAGHADGFSALEESYALESPFPWVGQNDGGREAGLSEHGAEFFKTDAFLNILNEPKHSALADGAYRKDLAGYEINQGYPIFNHQLPRPVVTVTVTGAGRVTANGTEVNGKFKTDFRSVLDITVTAGEYYVVESVLWRGEAIAIGNLNEATFRTGEVCEKSVLTVVFKKEMRVVILGGVSAEKVYDGTTGLSADMLTFGEKGLYILNPYAEGDLAVLNDFTGGDPIRASFGYPNANAEGQYIVLSNVKFGGSALDFYHIPNSFILYGAEILRAELTISYGGIDEDTQLYTANAAHSVYGDEMTDGKRFGMSVNDPNFLLYGEFYLTIDGGSGYRRYYEGEKLDVGTYKLKAGGLYAPNYNVTFSECVLIVEKRNLTAGFLDVETEYGGRHVFEFYFNGFAVGDDANAISVLPYFDGGRLKVGRHSVTLAGGSAPNYNIVNLTGTVVVRPKAISIRIIPLQHKIYGDAEPSWTGTSDGLCEGDILFIIRETGESAMQYLSSGYRIMYAGEDVTACYLVAVENPDEPITIRPRHLTITAEDAESVYGGFPLYGFRFFNLAPNDSRESVGSLGMAVYAIDDTEFANPILTAVTRLHAGRYLIKPYGGANSNYEIEFCEGILTVQKAVLRFTLTDQSTVYGAPFLFDYTVSGFVNLETESVIDFLGLVFYLDGRVFTRADVGIYALCADGAEAENYSFVYAAGILTVEKARLTITVKNPLEVVYGEIISVEYEFEGFAAGDTSENQLTGLRLIYALTTEEQTAVPYAAAKNYELTFVGNTLKMDKRIVTVAGVSALDKLYDGKDTAAITGTPYVMNAVSGDTLGLVGSLSAKFDAISAGLGIGVTLAGLTLDGERAHMYELVLPKLYANISINTVTRDG